MITPASQALKARYIHLNPLRAGYVKDLKELESYSYAKGGESWGTAGRSRAALGLDTVDLKSGSRIRTVAKARSVLCYLAVRRLGFTSAKLSKEPGISPSAVSKAVVRGKGFDGANPGVLWCPSMQGLGWTLREERLREKR